MCCGGRREQKANACCAALVLAARQALLLGREKAGRATPVEAPCKGVCPSASCEAAGSALLKMGAPVPQQPAANLQTAWHVARHALSVMHAGQRSANDLYPFPFSLAVACKEKYGAHHPVCYHGQPYAQKAKPQAPFTGQHIA